jgi:AcrR family transcriptional regulator
MRTREPPPDAPRRRGARRPRTDTLRQLKETGLDLFTRNGFDATTVDEIASRAGISRRTFFRYFGSKEDVVLSWIEDETQAAWPLLLDRSPGEEPLMAMRRAFATLARRHVHDLENTRRWMTLIFETPSLRTRFDSSVTRCQSRLDAALETQGSDDRCALFKVRVQNAAAVAAYIAAMQAWIAEGNEDSLDFLVSAAFDALAPGQTLSRACVRTQPSKALS